MGEGRGEEGRGGEEMGRGKEWYSKRGGRKEGGRGREKMGNTPCIGPYNTSYLRHVMLSYVVYTVVYIIVYCNDDWRVKDGVVHHSRQQSLVAKWLGLCVYS